MKRPYNQKNRAEAQERTRQKIVDAAVELHQEKGLVSTSVDDIAKRAKVGKVTVYRHFPNEMELVNACSGHYFQMNPFPDLESWAEIKDQTKRIRQGIKETFQFHQRTSPMMKGILSEARDHPAVKPYHGFWIMAADTLAPKADKKLKAKLNLALSFDTWNLLMTEQGLSQTEALQIVFELLNVSD